MERVRRNFMLPVALDRELAEMAAALGEKKSDLVGRALSHYLDLLDMDIARERARRSEAGKSRVLTPKELRQALGL